MIASKAQCGEPALIWRNSCPVGKPGRKSSRDRWLLLFPLKILDCVRDPIPFVKCGNVPKREHFVRLFLGPSQRTRAMKPDELAGDGLNFGLLHGAV